MENIFNAYVNAIDNCVEWNATAAITCCMLGKYTPLIADYGFEHLQPIHELSADDGKILQDLIYDHRKAIGDAKRKYAERDMGVGRLGGVKYHKFVIGSLTTKQVMEFRTLVVA